MASSRSIEVKVGAFILTAAALLAGFVLIMGGVNFQPTFTVVAVFDNPGGLQTGAQVKIAGVKVGKVESLTFCKDRKDLNEMPADMRGGVVCMDVTIEKRHKPGIRKNATFYITTQGLLGEQYLAIDPGSGDQGPLFSEPILPVEKYVRGLDPPRLDRLLAETYDLLLPVEHVEVPIWFDSGDDEVERVRAEIDRRPDLTVAGPVRRVTVEERTPIGHPPILCRTARPGQAALARL